MASNRPVGVTPFWSCYPRRILELTEAVHHHIDYAITNHGITNVASTYRVIANWAAEVKALAELMAEQEGK